MTHATRSTSFPLDGQRAKISRNACITRESRSGQYRLVGFNGTRGHGSKNIFSYIHNSIWHAAPESSLRWQQNYVMILARHGNGDSDTCGLRPMRR